MNINIKRALAASDKDLPQGLFAVTKASVLVAARKRAATHFALCTSISLFTIVTAITEAIYAHEFSLQSGFYNYLSLLFSDTSVALSSVGKDLFISAVETFPVLAGALFFASICALCMSITRVIYWRATLTQAA